MTDQRSPWRERPLTPAEAAILFHPDRATPWAPSALVHLAVPLEREAAVANLAALAERAPIVDARLDLRGSRWVAQSGRLALEALGDPLAVLRTRFDLASGPPLRVALDADGRRLAVVAHHAALDGRALVMVARALLGAHPIEATSPQSEPVVADPAGSTVADPAGGAREAVRRLARPADRVAASAEPPTSEAFVADDVPEGVPLRVAGLAAAATSAAARWNAERGAAWEQVGLTIPVGGPAVLGNVSTHRRVDLAVPGDVAGAVQAALATAVPPPDAALTPSRARLLRLLAPISARLSDSLLVSNLGRVDLPGARAVDFFPQARGRSAVALGACTPVEGTPRLTLRARDLGEDDARALLALVVEELRAER